MSRKLLLLAAAVVFSVGLAAVPAQEKNKGQGQGAADKSKEQVEKARAMAEQAKSKPAGGKAAEGKEGLQGLEDPAARNAAVEKAKKDAEAARAEAMKQKDEAQAKAAEAKGKGQGGAAEVKDKSKGQGAAAKPETKGQGQGKTQQLKAVAKQMAHEEAKHRQRVARLNRIRELAQNAGDTDKVTLVNELATREQKRYEATRRRLQERGAAVEPAATGDQAKGRGKHEDANKKTDEPAAEPEQTETPDIDTVKDTGDDAGEK